MIVEYHPAVEAEVDNARKYYDKELPGLGDEFVEEFERRSFVSRQALNSGR